MLKIKVDKGSEISFKRPFALKVKEKKAVTIYLVILKIFWFQDKNRVRFVLKENRHIVTAQAFI